MNLKRRRLVAGVIAVRQALDFSTDKAIFTVIIGWLALRPLFETFGLTRLAQLAGWLLVVSAAAGYGRVSTST